MTYHDPEDKFGHLSATLVAMRDLILLQEEALRRGFQLTPIQSAAHSEPIEPEMYRSLVDREIRKNRHEDIGFYDPDIIGGHAVEMAQPRNRHQRRALKHRKKGN